MPQIHAELTGDGTQVVLIAGGLGVPEELALAAKKLKSLTPLFTKSDPPGALLVPLTWPALVQLAATFGPDWRPGPRLQAWVREETARRTAPLADRLSYTPPEGLVPRPYQVAGALEIARTGKALIFDEPRTGKTITTILGLIEWSMRGCTTWQYESPTRTLNESSARSVSASGSTPSTSGRTASESRASAATTTSSSSGTESLGCRPTSSATSSTGSSSARPTDPARRGPVLVVCPASVVDPWVEAWRAWAPHLTTVAWRGPKRAALAGTADVYVTSYETARMDAGPVTSNGKRSLRPLVDLGAAALVVDECHYIKNPRTARSQAVRRLAKGVCAFVALSGTPITHHPGDLWPTLDALEHDAWPAGGRWISRYCLTVPNDGEYEPEVLGLMPATEPEFRLTILGQHRRVARADVMADLPPKVYSVRTVELPAKWRKAYDDFEDRMLADLPDDGGELSVMDVQSKFTLLSQLASAAADVEITYGPDVDEQTGQPKRHVHLELKAPSWKVDALLEILEERCGDNGGDQVVTFAPSKQLIRLAGAAAQAAGYRVGYVVGGQSQTERTDTIRAFQAGALDLICATTGAGGTGITLSAAGTLVFLQRPWSLVESLQAEDRAEGDLNATRGTEVIDVVAKDTIDSRVRAVLRERAGQLADLVQDPRIVAELLGGTGRSEAAA